MVLEDTHREFCAKFTFAAGNSFDMSYDSSSNHLPASSDLQTCTLKQTEPTCTKCVCVCV